MIYVSNTHVQNDHPSEKNTFTCKMVNSLLKFILLVIVLVIVLVNSIGKSHAEITSHQTFCQRLISGSIKEPLDHNKNVVCQSASANWFDLINDFENYAAPVSLSRIKQYDFHILILSPKWSSAYDISTRTLIEYYNSLDLNVAFTLFNYQGNEEQARAMIKTAERNDIDLIYSMGSETTAFMSKYYHKGKLPVVTVCNKDPISIGQVKQKLGISQTNIAYTSLNLDVSTQVAYFKEKFLPDLKHIAVIYHKHNSSSIVTQVEPLKNYLKNSNDGITLDLIEIDFDKNLNLLDSAMAKFIQQSSQPSDSVFLITGSTKLFKNISRINNNSDEIPVLSVTPSHVKAGNNSVFMAIGVSFQTNAKLAADYGYRILVKGKSTKNLPVGVVLTPDIAINFSRKPTPELKVPFSFFEDAVVIYNHDGEQVRINGNPVNKQ